MIPLKGACLYLYTHISVSGYILRAYLNIFTSTWRVCDRVYIYNSIISITLVKIYAYVLHIKIYA